MKRNIPECWIPSLYFYEGIPYIIVNVVSVILFKRFGMDNAAIAVWTSLFNLPWILKALWAPIIDMYGTKRFWVLAMQLLLGGGFCVAALILKVHGVQFLMMALFLVLGFASATHDAAADGMYMIALDEHRQALFSGLRGTFYRLAMITAQGGLVVLAGWFEKIMPVDSAWSLALMIAGGMLLVLWLYHSFSLPMVEAVAKDEQKVSFVEAFVSFFRKRGIVKILLFLLFYRFGEAQLGKIAPLFLIDDCESGGLALSVAQQGTIYGTAGVIALLAGGIAGGAVIARQGFRFWILPMALALNLPDLFYVILAYWLPESMMPTAALVALEQFGYGFGFALYMLFMVAVAEDSGRYRTSHFALMTGLMALGVMLPGMVAGKIQELLGYGPFFIWVVICTLPSFLVAVWGGSVVRPDFGRK